MDLLLILFGFVVFIAAVIGAVFAVVNWREKRRSAASYRK